MNERAGGGQAIGLSIGIIVGCVTIFILIVSGRLLIAPSLSFGVVPE